MSARRPPSIHSTNVELMLGHRLRRWPNIYPTLAECTMYTKSVLGPLMFVEKRRGLDFELDLDLSSRDVF